jgi:hypothetical protein
LREISAAFFISGLIWLVTLKSHQLGGPKNLGPSSTLLLGGFAATPDLIVGVLTVIKTIGKGG